MTYSLFIALLGFAFVTSVTPGPNNMMLLASGVNFGFRRTLPHMLGVSVGSSVQMLIVASGLAWVMAWFDALRAPLVAAGCAYLLWLALRQARAGQPGRGGRAAPLGFLGAAMFQWVNPKAWMMALNAAILFLPPNAGWQAAAGLALVCLTVNLPCIALWAGAGARLREGLQAPAALRLFNYTMAMLLAATAAWIAADEAGAFAAA